MDSQIRKRIIQFYRERYCVISVNRATKDMFGQDIPLMASGTLIKNGTILTAAHTFAGQETLTAIEMPFRGLVKVDPKMIYADIELDIAVFRIPDQRWDCPDLPIADVIKYADTCVALFPVLGVKMITGIGRVVGQFNISAEGRRARAMAMWDMTAGSGSSGAMVMRVHDNKAVGMIQMGLNIFHDSGDNVMLPAGISSETLKQLI